MSAARSQPERSQESPVSQESPRTEEPPEIGFEESVAELESVVDRLEHEELELEEALSVFERGVALSRQCAAKLAVAETRIDQLVREGGAWFERPFDSGATEDVDAPAETGEDGFPEDEE